MKSTSSLTLKERRRGTCQRARGLGILLAIALAPVCQIHASQGYALDWFSLEAGDRTSSGGSYSVAGTIGTVDVGRTSGGSFSVESGVFYVATERVPLLSLALTNRVATLYWPRSFGGFVLEQTPTLQASPLPWSKVTSSYLTNETHISVNVPMSSRIRFFRLRQH